MTTPNLGFLTIIREPLGYVGGYLVTNSWGRPLEFRLSTAVQPNKIQQVLYGTTLEPFVCGELIGKTLVEKTATPAGLIVTDHPAVLGMRAVVDVPLVFLADSTKEGLIFQAHPAQEGDRLTAEALATQLSEMDWREPFTRVREAIAEARQLGIARRAA